MGDLVGEELQEVADRGSLMGLDGGFCRRSGAQFIGAEKPDLLGPNLKRTA